MTSGPMTMHDQIHPDDERLAALAGSEPEAVADAALAAHVQGCLRCSNLVRDLHLLQAALGELPDLAPSRPLQLIPAVPDARPSGTWLRRLFAPGLVVGSALVLVGAVGLLGNGAAATPVGASYDRSLTGGETAASPENDVAAPGAFTTASPTAAPPTAPAAEGEAPGGFDLNLAILAIVAGIVLIGAAVTLRYVVVPRAG
jgi:hypothetical protein